MSDELLKQPFAIQPSFQDRRLTNLSVDQVDRVIVRRNGGEIELFHDASGWRIVRPLHALADEQKVEAFLKKVLELHILEFVANDSEIWVPMGLLKAR